jgi:eukaryotic-like serine/threonine-protein kinase
MRHGVTEGRISSARFPGVEYELRRLVGCGATSNVYFALRRGSTGVDAVAIKVFSERPGTASLAFEKEVAALSNLHDHPRLAGHVVRLLDFGASGSKLSEDHVAGPWMALEYVIPGAQGATLAERVRHALRCDGHAFGVTRAVRVIRSLGVALDAAHDLGIVHRDVKPSNILCRDEPTRESWLLADFGICRSVDQVGTFGGLVVGTPGYAPPEQASVTTRRVGPFSDVFGFAAVVFFMLTGEPYFAVTHPDEVMLSIQRGRRRGLEDAAGLAPELRGHAGTRLVDAIVARATSARPEERPQHAGELARELIEALEGAAFETGWSPDSSE